MGINKSFRFRNIKKNIGISLTEAMRNIKPPPTANYLIQQKK
jgi:hypothetical protein